jgi:hypothetical protein
MKEGEVAIAGGLNASVCFAAPRIEGIGAETQKSLSLKMERI